MFFSKKKTYISNISLKVILFMHGFYYRFNNLRLSTSQTELAGVCLKHENKCFVFSVIMTCRLLK